MNPQAAPVRRAGEADRSHGACTPIQAASSRLKSLPRPARGTVACPSLVSHLSHGKPQLLEGLLSGPAPVLDGHPQRQGARIFAQLRRWVSLEGKLSVAMLHCRAA